MRGLALYHYLNGRLDAAYRILRRETENAIAAGSPHSPFVDPYILDMLYGFTRAGYPDIPRYTFRDTLEALLRSPNRQLRGAALRVKALCLRDGRADLVGCGGNRSRKPPPPKRGLPRLFPGRTGIGPVPPRAGEHAGKARASR